MRPDVKYLIKCYLNNGAADQDENDAGNQETSKGFSVSLNASECSGGAIRLISYPTNRNADFSRAVVQLLLRRPQELELDANQRRIIRNRAAAIRAAADDFRVRRNQALLAVERGILQNEDLNNEERAAVDAIHSLKDCNTSLFSVAGCLKRCLTTKTLKAALRYLSYSASSSNQELGIACELISILMAKLSAAPSSCFLSRVFEEFIEDRLEDWFEQHGQVHI